MKRYIKAEYIRDKEDIARRKHYLDEYMDLFSEHLSKVFPKNFTYVDASGNTRKASLRVKDFDGYTYYDLLCLDFMYSLKGVPVKLLLSCLCDRDAPKYGVKIYGFYTDGSLYEGDSETYESKIKFKGETVLLRDSSSIKLSNASYMNYDPSIFNQVTSAWISSGFRKLLDEAYRFRDKYEEYKEKVNTRTKLGGPSFVKYTKGLDVPDQFFNAVKRACKTLRLKSEKNEDNLDFYDPEHDTGNLAALSFKYIYDELLPLWQSSRLVKDFDAKVVDWLDDIVSKGVFNTTSDYTHSIV